jgi:hypothetical protein
MLLADGLTDATVVLALVTLFVAAATWRLGSRASEETRAQWRPVILVRARHDAQDVKLRLAQGHLEVDVENAGRGPALDVFTEGLKGLERLNPRVSALAPGERWTCNFTMAKQPDSFMFRVNYSDISGGGFSTTVLLGVDAGKVELAMQDVTAHPSLNLPWRALIPRGRLRRWSFRRLAEHRGYSIPEGSKSNEAVERPGEGKPPQQ